VGDASRVCSVGRVSRIWLALPQRLVLCDSFMTLERCTVLPANVGGRDRRGLSAAP
jgi:hypothetical protein